MPLYLILSPLQEKDTIIWLTFFYNSLEHKLNSNHFEYISQHRKTILFKHVNESLQVLKIHIPHLKYNV